MTLFGWRWKSRPTGEQVAAHDDAAMWVSLAQRVERGDREAEAELVRQCYVRVRPMVSAHLHGSDAALDIAQETVLATLEALRLGRIREPERLPAFVLGIARNLINNHRRKVARGRETQDDPPDRPVEAAPELARLDEQQRILVRASLKRLNRIDRRILLLTLADGMAPREIAPIVGLTPDVVRTRKSRAVRVLADEIQAMTRSGRPDHVPKSGKIP